MKHTQLESLKIFGGKLILKRIFEQIITHLRFPLGFLNASGGQPFRSPARIRAMAVVEHQPGSQPKTPTHPQMILAQISNTIN
ncbi:hypothetical protein COCON_G00197160 [Conger conger]|uniref:Uncharacterized protein n=1 Tax=Conger conger TaxID=82655 RepID=A0A9Q1D1R8_CONCO|nr:hypothetical protein COCON_G00197160 [Conger conger]